MGKKLILGLLLIGGLLIGWLVMSKPSQEELVLKQRFADSLLNYKQTQKTLENSKCKLETDTFSFKGIVIGANISTIKNKKKIDQYWWNEAWNIQGEIECNEVPNISMYEILDAKNYTIFKTNISSIYVGCYNNKIFSILIGTEGDANLVSEINRKYGGNSCVEHREWDKWGVRVSSLNLLNEKLSMVCSDYSARLPETIDDRYEPGSSSFNVYDVAVQKYIDNILLNNQLKKDSIVSNDF
jgi:hypothetical protein